jgi:alpha-aminoadipate carrier protein LysW
VTTQTACPECDAAVPVPADSYPSEVIECLGCRTELEIIAVSPPVLALAPTIEEDWGE